MVHDVNQKIQVLKQAQINEEIQKTTKQNSNFAIKEKNMKFIQNSNLNFHEYYSNLDSKSTRQVVSTFNLVIVQMRCEP